MKPTTSCRRCLLFLLLIVVAGQYGCKAASKDKEQTTADVAKTTDNATAIEGNWKLVSGNWNGNDLAANNLNKFKIFHEGYFAMIESDPQGKLTEASYGKYEVEGNTLKESFLYHSANKLSGAVDWQKYEIKGDTLITTGFQKVMVDGKEVTGDYPKFTEKRVRVK